MKFVDRIARLNRLCLIAGAAALALASCGSPNEATGAASAAETLEVGVAMGEANAPVTVVEYASVTCVHCAAFHRQVLPTIKSEYVDTGQVRFVFREFPTAPQELAVAGFMLARCAGESKYFDMIGALFRRQRALLSSQYPADELRAIGRAAGFDEAEFDACLQDQTVLEMIDASIRAGLEDEITGTPAFLINGRLESGLRNIDQFRQLLDEALAASGETAGDG